MVGHKHRVKGPVKKYCSVASELCLVDGLLLRGSRIVIPASLQEEIVQKLHTGHLGITKTLEKARISVWWPGITSQLKEAVQNCATCIKERSQRPEPLMTSEGPSRPWQNVGTDLFELKGHTYLLLVDYLSRFPEIVKLSDTTSKEVISHIKSIFARYGIPETVRSDNGPQYCSREFAEFARQYQFKHITSSPRFPRSNGEAERMVKTVNNLLRKAEDPYLALLAY